MSQQVFLLDPESGRAVEAGLVSLGSKHLNDWANEWKPYHERQLTELRAAGLPAPEHAHWSWEDKAAAFEGLLSYQGFAVECNGMTQGIVFCFFGICCTKKPQGINCVCHSAHSV